MFNVEKLIVAYSNEKSTAKLLQYKEIVDEFNDYISSQESTVVTTELIKTIEEIELERIKYFVKEYILARLDKIRHNLFLNIDLMSVDEKHFYEEYLQTCKNTTVFVEQPSQESEIIGFIANKEIQGAKIDGDIVDINKGDFFVASFDDVQNQLAEDSIYLV